jgi:hypothetical protein
MLSTILCLSSIASLHCSDVQLPVPRPSADEPAAATAARLEESGCGRFDIRISANGEVEVLPLTMVGCGPVQPVLAGDPIYDPSTRRIRLPIALQNMASYVLRAPAFVSAHPDSIRIHAPASLARARRQTGLVSPVNADAPPSAATGGAFIWRFDTSFAVVGAQELQPGNQSDVRWIEIEPRHDVQRFLIILHARSERVGTALGARPPAPGDAHRPVGLALQGG